MSIIPKITVGMSGKKRSKCNLDFDNSTTLNIGDIQPTMCREMVPNETMKVKVSSLVRLAPMPVPTFARMSLRHYHTFVPYSELWQPFTAFLSGGTYTNSLGQSFIPKGCPVFNGSQVSSIIATFSDVSVYSPLLGPLTITKDNTSQWDQIYKALKFIGFPSVNSDTIGTFYRGDYISSFYKKQGITGSVGRADILNAPGVVRLGGSFLAVNNTTFDELSATEAPTFARTHNYTTSGLFSDPNAGVITPEGADYVVRGEVGGNPYYLCYKLKIPAKKLRSIFIGLGYTFDPFQNVNFSVFKLLAYYKSWYELFSPNRDKTFNETSCYKIIKYISAFPAKNIGFIDIMSAGSTGIRFYDFLNDLMVDCTYYLPMDYFGMATLKPYDNFYDKTMSSESNGITISTGTGSYTDKPEGPEIIDDKVAIANGNSTVGGTPVTITGSTVDPLVLRLANRLLTFAGKNTVIGRQIQDYLRVHYGITASEHHADDSSVYKLGSSRVQVNVSDIMSTADTETAKVGDYAGKGIGYGNSDTVEYTAKEFGCWITLTALVPESGYYQGYLRENRQYSRFDFFTPEFDALGYQVLERGEIYNSHDTGKSSLDQYFPNDCRRAFGFVPRYSHMKIGRNIVNGDMSLPSLRDSMSAYHFDRMFPTRKIVLNGNFMNVSDPEYVPTVITDSFRKIDPSDRLGNYNRIFNYVDNDVDHFILHNCFSVTAIAPFKSLSDSFDTVVEDDKTISVTKA